MSLRRLIHNFYLFQLFSSLFLWLPIYYEYQKTLGLNEGQIFTVQSFYYIALGSLELPTGMLADSLGRVLCLRLGSLALILSHCLVGLMPSYEGFLIHFALIAFARSLFSGASSAYLYEHLQSYRLQGRFKMIEGRARAAGLIGRVICWPAVGLLVQYHFSLPYWGSAIFSAIAFGLALQFPSEKASRQTGGPFQHEETPGDGLRSPAVQKWTRDLKKAIDKSLKPAVSICFSQPQVLMIILQGITIAIISRLCVLNLFQPLLREKLFSTATFGWILSIMTLFEAMGSWNLGTLKTWVPTGLSDARSLFALNVIAALCLLLISVSGHVGTVAGLLGLAFCMGIGFPLQGQLLNDAVTDSGYRVTLLSLVSGLDRLFCAISVSLAAGFVQSGQIALLFMTGAFLTLALSGLQWVFVRGWFVKPHHFPLGENQCG